jgi:DNA ligase (NAD+)
MDEGLIFQPADIFTLQEGDLSSLARFADKSAKNLMLAIQRSKKISLARFILSLGIRHVGEETAIDLANNFLTLDSLRKASQMELENISEVGPKIAESIYAWFKSEKNKRFIDSLLSVGINILPPDRIDRKLAGQTFVFTGTLETIVRDKAKERVRLLGGNVSESISKETDYLVAGSSPGSKIKQAERLGVKIINEQEFVELTK